MEEGERTALASVAQKSGESRGRQHCEPSHAYRTEFQRDRARIIHSRAFRRLEYKTQVFLNGTGDHLRTRLTHSIEVASISRTIARALRLNEDLAEAIALAHDLGHAPFGHSGEEMLFVVSGRVAIELDGEELKLEKGDCLYFSGEMPHQVHSLGRQKAEVLVVIAAGVEDGR